MNHLRRRLSFLLFCTALFAYGLIYSGFGNWNSIGRIGLAIALAERGEPFIDEFAALTGDKATIGNRFASDKAPGLSFLALPTVSVAVKILRRLGTNAKWTVNVDSGGAYLSSQVWWVQWFATLATSSLFTALAVVALFRIALLQGVSTQAAAFSALIYAFATPTWGWATTFFSHATCGALLVFGLWTVLIATTPTVPSSKIASMTWGLSFGLFLGTAIVVEYFSVFAALFIASYGLWRSVRLTPERTGLGVAGALIGAFAAGIPLMMYNNILMGSPLSLTYSYSDWSGLRGGLWGMSLPDLTVALKLLIGKERGLLWLSPVLALTPFAFASMWKSGEQGLMVLCVTIFLSFWVINSSFFYWMGGWATGPRYITPALPFLALPFAWLWDSSVAIMRTAAMGLALLSGSLCFVVAAVEPYSPAPVERPEYAGRNAITEVVLPKLENGFSQSYLLAVQLGFNPPAAVIFYLLGVWGGLTGVWRTASTNISERVYS